MVTLFAVCTIAPSSAAGVKPPIPDIDADDIGAATIVLATCNRLYRLALPIESAKSSPLQPSNQHQCLGQQRCHRGNNNNNATTCSSRTDG